MNDDIIMMYTNYYVFHTLHCNRTTKLIDMIMVNFLPMLKDHNFHLKMSLGVRKPRISAQITNVQ